MAKQDKANILSAEQAAELVSTLNKDEQILVTMMRYAAHTDAEKKAAQADYEAQLEKLGFKEKGGAGQFTSRWFLSMVYTSATMGEFDTRLGKLEAMITAKNAKGVSEKLPGLWRQYKYVGRKATTMLIDMGCKTQKARIKAIGGDTWMAAKTFISDRLANLKRQCNEVISELCPAGNEAAAVELRSLHREACADMYAELLAKLQAYAAQHLAPDAEHDVEAAIADDEVKAAAKAAAPKAARKPRARKAA